MTGDRKRRQNTALGGGKTAHIRQQLVLLCPALVSMQMACFDTSLMATAVGPPTSSGQAGPRPAVLVQPDGKIVLAGESNAGFTVARYLPARSCIASRDLDGDGCSDLCFAKGIGTAPLRSFGTAPVLYRPTPRTGGLHADRRTDPVYRGTVSQVP